MATPSPLSPSQPSQSSQPSSPDAWGLLRAELNDLADALVDAYPTDRAWLRTRVRQAVEAQRRCGLEQSTLTRLLQHILSDLSGDGATLDTLYYARQIVMQSDRLPN